MTGDMLISGDLCWVSLERLFVCLRPSECINYFEQNLQLTLPFLAIVEVQQIESSNTSRTEQRRVVLRPRGIELSRDKSSVTVIQLLVVCQANLVL